MCFVPRSFLGAGVIAALLPSLGVITASRSLRPAVETTA
jgi:hypothetical protein